MSKFSPRQKRFVDEYLVDLNATQAAIRAGYSSKTAKQQSSRLLLTNVDVASAIATSKQERSDATNIDAEWVLNKAVDLYQRCAQEVTPVLHPRSHKQVRDEDGNPIYKFNAAGANRALEIIGKHVEVAAFRDRVEFSDGGLTLEERIQQGRKRMNWDNQRSGTTAEAIKSNAVGGTHG